MLHLVKLEEGKKRLNLRIFLENRSNLKVLKRFDNGLPLQAKGSNVFG